MASVEERMDALAIDAATHCSIHGINFDGIEQELKRRGLFNNGDIRMLIWQMQQAMYTSALREISAVLKLKRERMDETYFSSLLSDASAKDRLPPSVITPQQMGEDV